MRILEFSERFPIEKSCKENFRLKRESRGISCKSVVARNITGLRRNGIKLLFSSLFQKKESQH